MTKAQSVIAHVVGGVREPVLSTKLVKLVYLVDYLYYQHFGRTLTGFDYMWDNFGPNATGHAIVTEAHRLTAQGVLCSRQEPNIYGSESTRFSLNTKHLPALAPQEQAVVSDILARFGKMGLREIVAASKRTKPFKAAHQYEVLQLRRIAEPTYTTAEDLEAHQEELRKEGTVDLDQVKARLGII
ncbi:MAG: DUF4065 domain-containing protein [Chloroflexi bacterium]|nr:DUF4065 domain-containing protein [Chloroflexota bacterium]